jgi:hypothetical protein
MDSWIVGIACGFIALIGLVATTGAVDDGMYQFGIALMVFGVLMDFFLMKKAWDRRA